MSATSSMDQDRPVPRIVERTDGRWEIEGVPAVEASALLEQYAPWRMLLAFSSGPASDDGATFQPFNTIPLKKLQVVLPHIKLPPAPDVLDIGFNCGYNSLYMASRYNARVTGLDVVARHKELSDDLAALLELDTEFLLADTESFVRPESYDLVLHFGTLYHLPNPLRSVENCARSLRSGGWFALETTRYVEKSDGGKWIHGFNGDRTNFWALGTQVVTDFFQRSSLSPPPDDL